MRTHGYPLDVHQVLGVMGLVAVAALILLGYVAANGRPSPLWWIGSVSLVLGLGGAYLAQRRVR